MLQVKTTLKALIIISPDKSILGLVLDDADTFVPLKSFSPSMISANICHHQMKQGLN